MAKVPVASDPEGIEKQNQFWWGLRQEALPHVIEVPLESALPWPPARTDAAGKAAQVQVGGYCRVPLPVTGVVRWGFARAADLAAFKAQHGL